MFFHDGLLSMGDVCSDQRRAFLESKQLFGEALRGSEVGPSTRRHRVDPEFFGSPFENVFREIQRGDRVIEVDKIVVSPGSGGSSSDRSIEALPEFRDLLFEKAEQAAAVGDDDEGIEESSVAQEGRCGARVRLLSEGCNAVRTSRGTLTRYDPAVFLFGAVGFDAQ
jgi:hypothetical protein